MIKLLRQEGASRGGVYYPVLPCRKPVYTTDAGGAALPKNNKKLLRKRGVGEI
jgi:uncharacterized membrane protein